VKNELETHIKNFIESEDYRSKENTPDLGVLLAMLSVSSNYQFDEIKQSLMYESFDRKILWMSKKVPSILVIEQEPFNEAKANEAFLSSKISY
jgi:hypothetical protein